MIAAMAVVAGAAFADTTPITSANVVGFQQFGTGDYMTQVGAAFIPLKAEGKWVCDTKVFDNDVVAGDTIYIFDPEVWNLNYWQFGGFTTGGESLGWAYSFTSTETWEPDSTVVESFELNRGQTIQFQPNDAMSGMTVSGEVEDTSKSATWTLAAGEWIGDIMNPYPVDTTLADLESFAVAGDILYVFNYNFWNLDYYQYGGKGTGWTCDTTSSETWEAISYVVEDNSLVVMPAGTGGTYQPTDMDGRTWTVTLSK